MLEIEFWNIMMNSCENKKLTYHLLLGHRKVSLHLFHYLEDLKCYNIIFVVLQIW
jgi:hypothetical protein